MQEIRVGIWGFGAMGSGIAKMIASKKGIVVTGVCDKWDKIVGKDMYELLDLERGNRPEVKITADENEVFYPGSCDIAILATDSFVKAQMDKLVHCIELGMDVISTAEEMAWPQAQFPAEAKEIDVLAKRHGVTVLGTGINPGFVLDYLILALTGTCEQVLSIEAARVNDLAPFGAAVMHEQGVGITMAEFERRMAIDDLAGHVGFPESVGMIAAGMGVEIAEQEITKDPIITEVDRKSKYGEAKTGNLAGIRQQIFARKANGETFIHLDHPQQICPEDANTDTGDYITIHTGDYDMNMQIKPETPGGIGTIAMVVNMIPQTLTAAPGLKTMLDLPVPRCIMGDFRDQLVTDRFAGYGFKKGDYVVVEVEILTPDERAPQVPDDTKEVSFIALYKGYLEDESANAGDEVTIKTVIGREVKGILTTREVSPTHTYGKVVPELMKAHEDVREFVFEGEE